MKYLDASWMAQLDAEAARRDRAAWGKPNPSLERARAVSDACVAPPITVTESNTEAAWADWDHATEQLDRKEIQA